MWTASTRSAVLVWWVDVERAVADGDDRRVVHDVRARDLDERAVPGAGHGSGLELGQREPVGPGTAVRVGLKSGAPAK